MPRILFVPFLAAAFLVAPAMLPPAFAPATTFGLSGSAQAVTTVNASKSNSLRTKKAGKIKQPRGTAKRDCCIRGTKSNGDGRTRATTVKSSKGRTATKTVRK